jgi:hypothetical protein
MGMLYIRTSYILYVCEVYWDFKVYSKYGDIDSMYKYIYICIYAYTFPYNVFFCWI